MRKILFSSCISIDEIDERSSYRYEAVASRFKSKDQIDCAEKHKDINGQKQQQEVKAFHRPSVPMIFLF